MIMLSEDTKRLQFNQYQKSDEATFIIFSDLQCLIEKIDGYKNNPEKLSATKVNEHVPLSLSMSTISPFKNIENKHDVYKGKDYIKKFCESLREYPMKVINFKKKKHKFINKRAAGII